MLFDVLQKIDRSQIPAMNSKLQTNLVAFLMMNIAVAGSASAAVIVQFQESGGNVIGTATGTFKVPLIAPIGTSSSTNFAGGFNFLYNYGGTLDSFSGGVWSLLGSGFALNQAPTSASGDTFGYNVGVVYLESGLSPGSTFSPSTTWTWSGQTLSSIGLGSLGATPTKVYTAPSDGDTISFAAIPEPSSSSFLLGTATLLLVANRRRTKKQNKA